MIIYYKHNNHDLVVKCIPELPENISLDNNNNIHITIYDSIDNIINMDTIPFHIGQRTFHIPIKELKIQKTQQYILKKRGISIIQSNNVYDNTEKSNIVCNIQLS